MVAVVIPCALLYFNGFDTLQLWERIPFTRVALPIAGLLPVCAGLWLMGAAIRLFATVGDGTLAPWIPTRQLVVQGIYRHVRNPMISGVFFVLVGEAVGTASLPLLGWSILFITANAIYIPLQEEPGLRKRFGEPYREYCRNVRRWWPSSRPWTPPD